MSKRRGMPVALVVPAAQITRIPAKSWPLSPRPLVTLTYPWFPQGTPKVGEPVPRLGETFPQFGDELLLRGENTAGLGETLPL